MLPAIKSQKSLAISLNAELPAYFNKAEIDAILETVMDKPKEHLLINVLWQTGARISEALNLKVADIDFYTKTIKLLTLKRKGAKKAFRVLPVQGNLVGELGSYIVAKGIGRDERLFNISRQRAFQVVRQAVLKAKLDRKRAHPHVLRHSFAVHCILNGVPVLVVKDWLGHSNILNTLVYCKVLSSDSRHFYKGLRF